ncbi:MAG: DUF3999 family protein [Flavobacteriaceae bacterium]
MKQKSNSLIIATILSCACSFAQMTDYDFKRSIVNTTEGWHKIALPDAIFGKTQNFLDDIRIYGITKNNDTIEAPYILKTSTEKTINKQVTFKTLNQSHDKKGYYITFEIPTTEAINQIELDFNTTNFDWNITLEGSQNQNTWFTLLDNYRIISIENTSTQFKFTKLNFNNAKYRYYRLFIATDKNPEFIGASLLKHETVEGLFNPYNIKQFSINTNTEDKQTEINIELLQSVPVSYLKLNCESTFDYYRPVSVKYLADSTKTEQGWKYGYNTIASGILNSANQTAFEFAPIVTKKLKVLVHNQNNTPLTINTATVKGFRYELITRITQEASYALVYGNKNAHAPNYDLNYFHDKIPTDAPLLPLGNEQNIEKPKTETVTPLFQSKLWLWGLMVVVIVLLGTFTAKMMKKA